MLWRKIIGNWRGLSHSFGFSIDAALKALLSKEYAQ